jgi:hypothetical protein
MGNFDEYYPFDIGHGNPANTARWRKMAQLWCIDGVVSNYLSTLTASLAGGTATIQPGAVFLHGYYGEVQNAQTISGVGTNGTIVAGVDFNNQVLSIYYRDGVLDYGANPATNYQQDTSKWEMPLWLVTGTGLVDIRTMINPGRAAGWWATAAGPIPVSSTATVQTNFMTLRVPYAGQGLLRGEMLVTFSDASQAQSAICQLTYQFGSSEQQVSPTITPGIPGGGPAGVPVAVPVALSGLVPVTQGKKGIPTGGVGWRVTAGTGPGLSVATLTGSLTMLNLPAAA